MNSPRRLDPLLKPRSIAVVGASARPGSPGNEVLVNLRKGSFAGDLFAVNPGSDSIDGLACYPSLSALPLVPQHVVFAVSDARVEACLDEAIALGVPAATIFSSLQLQQDRSPPLRRRVRDKALAAGLLLHGGNCMGFFNFHDGVWISGFDTRAHNAAGNVALLSQSGAGMSGILDCEERLAFSFAASTGQELCLAMEDYLDYVLDLPETRVVGLFLETSRHPAKFIAALDKARQREVPIVVIKVGKSDLAAQLAVSHSGALVGSDASYQAVFDRYGVQRVDDMTQLATALIMFAQPCPVAGGGLVCLHDSGGERQLAIDLAEQLQVPLTELEPSTVERLEPLLDDGLPAVNPLDAWGSGGAGASQTMSECFTAILSDPGAALGAVIHDRAPGGEIYPSYVEYLRAAQLATGKPAFLVANHQGSGGDPRVVQATAQGTPVLDGLREFLVGARCMLSWRNFMAQADASALPGLDAGKLARWRELLRAGQPLSEAVAGDLLRDFDIPVATGVSIADAEQLGALSGQLRYPVVLKTAMPGIEHKSEVGGVILGLASFDELQAAYKQLAARLGPRALIVPMIEGAGVEMILGVARDAQFGPVVLLGLGGIHTEIVRDVAVLLPPFSPARARQAVDGLQMRKLLGELRGRPGLAIDQYCDMASRLSVLAVALADCIAEVDINPVRLMVDECIGLDALIVPGNPG
ncbi:MAG: acetate--CoA ligase family protein [Gammaproteobacteria bacterium]|nr:acetate--CoA ligase family protein [Gammaproteobacteria bacterium]